MGWRMVLVELHLFSKLNSIFRRKTGLKPSWLVATLTFVCSCFILHVDCAINHYLKSFFLFSLFLCMGLSPSLVHGILAEIRCCCWKCLILHSCFILDIPPTPITNATICDMDISPFLVAFLAVLLNMFCAVSVHLPITWTPLWPFYQQCTSSNQVQRFLLHLFAHPMLFKNDPRSSHIYYNLRTGKTEL